MNRRGTLLFHFFKNEESLIYKQTLFSTILVIILFFGFVITSVYTQKISWLIAISALLGLDLVLEWVVIIFLKKDAAREGNAVIENGSVWRGNKEYKVILSKLTNMSI